MLLMSRRMAKSTLKKRTVYQEKNDDFMQVGEWQSVFRYPLSRPFENQSPVLCALKNPVKHLTRLISTGNLNPLELKLGQCSCKFKIFFNALRSTPYHNLL
jgi:hypothetical protein